MAIYLPIVTQFNDKGIKAAETGLKDVETAADKMSTAARKGAKLAALGFAGLATAGAAVGAALFSAAKAAAEDEAGQVRLATQIKATTNASDAQIKGIEDFIDKTQRAVGVADDKLRPAFGRLTSATGDVNKAQDLLNIALNLSAATGKDVETVASALARAQEGAYGPLEKLGIGYEKGEIKARGFNDIQKDLENRFSGAALAKAETYEGTIDRLSITMSELKEQVGAKVLPIIADFADAGLKIFDAFGVSGAAGAIKELRLQIVGLGTDASGMQNTFGKIYDSIAGFANGVMSALAIPLATINFLRTGDLGTYKVKGLPTFAELMAEAAPKTVREFEQSTKNMTPFTPVAGLDKTQNTNAAVPVKSFDELNPKMPTGTGTNTMAGGLAGVGGFGGYNVNIEVNGGDPNAVVDALRTYMRQNGSVPIQVSNIF